MVNTLIKKHLFEGKFEIQGEIAKGQTGTILYGYDLESRQEVAIKIYHSNINGRLIQGKPFIEKSKPLLRLDHPNLIKIFNITDNNDTPIVFMEFFDAPNLQHIIHDKGPMPVQDMLLRARAITEVLVHIHFQGIIHGTLHPGHVLVGPQGQIKILDMGLSWILMDMLPNCDVELLRPLPYLPPEIAKEELLEVSSDLYCLGVMMFEMLTGTVPYAGLPKTSIMGKLAFDQADPELNFPAQIPEAVCDLIRQMTRNKANQRLKDTTHVLTIINQQLAKLPLSEEHVASTPKALQRQPPPPKEPTPPEKTPAPSAPSADSITRKPAPPKTPPFQRPQATVNYVRGQHNKLFRTIGITLSLIVLVGIAGILGYWYRDFFESQIATLQTQPDIPSQTTSLPHVTPRKDQSSVTPDQKSPQSQTPLRKKDERLKGQPQSLPIKKEVERRPPSNLTPPSNKSGMKPDKPGNTQPPHAPKTKQGNNLAPTKKPSDKTLTPAPSTPHPVVRTPDGSHKTPQPPNASKKAPPQQPTSQPSKASKAQQRKALAPTTNQSDATSPPAVTEKRQPVLSPSTDSKNRPLPPKTSKTVPRQQPTAFTPTKETMHPKTESTQFSPSSEEIHDELTDEEIEALLQSLDDPAIAIPSTTTP